ncbi:DHH family phosphoesterase [Alkalihalobacillus sp. NPDC078783]
MYVAKNENYNDLLEEVLSDRGINNLDLFTNPSQDSVLHWSLLRNIKEAVSLVLKHIKNGTKIFIQVDSDLDGYTSSAILINYLEEVFPDVVIVWRLQEGKEHGLILEEIPTDVGLVIAPDSGSSDYEIHKALKDMGIDVLVLDHHEADKESDDALVVNNQLSPLYTNKNLSGAGVVLKFCEAVDEHLGISLSRKYWDLAAIGNIADMMDMREPETRFYAVEGLKEIHNEFIKTLIEKQSFSMEGKMNFTAISFNISPMINAAIRIGTQEEKQEVMRALLGSEEEVYYKKKDINESLNDSLARRLSNIRAKQVRMRDKFMGILKDKIETNGLDTGKFIMVTHDNKEYKNIVGVAGNMIREDYKKPVLILSENEGVLSGSGRGFGTDIVDFKKHLLNTGKFEMCQGHANAFGVKITKEKAKELNDELMSDVTEGKKGEEVDFIIPFDSLYPHMISSVAELEDSWCHGAEEPTFLITDINLPLVEVDYLGKYKNTMKFSVGEHTFIKKTIKKEEKEELNEYENYLVDILCKFRFNKWNGNVENQIVIDKLIIKDRYLF